MKNRLSYITIFTAASSLLLGVSVLIGWYSGSTTLIQISPAFAPMQYNTALGFLFCGAGLLALHFNVHRLSAISAYLLVLIGGLTLLEYIFSIDLFIDQLLMDHYITTETSHPGRMAPNTALCFFLCGLALLAGRLHKMPRFLPGFGIISVVVFCLGFIALIGYFIDLEVVYGWGNLTRMAVHTAFGFIFISAGLYTEYIRLGKAGIVVKKSLVMDTMIKMIIATTIVVLISTGFIYLYIMATLESETVDSLEIYISERSKFESYRFIEGEKSHDIFGEIFSAEYARIDIEEQARKFHELFKIVDDGSYRTVREAYDGVKRPSGTLKLDITGYVMDVDSLTEELKARIMLLEDMTDHYGPAWIDRFPNLGVATPENAHVSYWPGSSFALDVPAGFDLREREWYKMALGDPNNTIYSSLVFDENLGKYAVSAARAVFEGSRHLFTIVNDLKVDDLIARVLEDPLAGTESFLIRKNGDLILHPTRTAAIENAEGDYNIFQQQDAELSEIMQLISSDASRSGVITDAGDDQFIAFSTLNGPGWYFVTIYPKQLLRASALNAVRFILLLGLFLIVLETSLLFLLLKGQVIQPLTRFITAINNITSSNFNLGDEASRELPLEREDEVGELARSFNSMAEQLADHSSSLEERVSERTKELSESQEAMLAQKDALDNTLENMDQGVIMYDDDLNILTYNSRYPEILNLPKDVIEKCHNYADVIRYFSEKVMLHSPKTIGELTSKAILKEKLIYPIELPGDKIIEVRHIPKDGGGYIRIFTDITKREQARIEAEVQVRELADARRATLNMMQDAEEASGKVQVSEERFTLAMEAANVGLWDVSLPSRKSVFNEQYFKMLGYEREDFEDDTQTWYDLIHPDDVDRLMQAADKLFNGDDKNYVHEFRMRASDEVFRTILTTGKIISRDDEGLPTRAIGVHLDITEQKELQAKIEKSEERFTLAMEAANVGLWDTSLPSRETIFNDQYFKMLGYERKDFEEDFQTFISLIHPDDRTRLFAVAEKLYAGEINTIQEEFRMVAASGETRTIITSGKLVSRGEDGKPTRTTGVHLDITERKKMEEDIQEARQAAESAAQAKASFLAAMSHEIRTPMNGVIGMVDLLRQTKMDNDQKRMLQTISNSGQSLLTIINDILDFSKIEAGKMDLENIPFSLSEVVEGSAQTIAPNAERKGIRLITYVDPDLPQFVAGDPVRIRQILINMGGNAIKFTEEGEVVIRAERMDNRENDNISVRFRVIDQGIGISEEAQEKLFEAFSQAETSTTRRFGGTGLGLTICKKLTEMMKGDLGVKSQLGEGSEFYVSLSFKTSDKVVEHESVRDLKGLRVLLVIDNQAEQSILKRYLEFWHADVETSTDLAICIKNCKSAVKADKPFDVVVMGPQWPREEQFSLRDKASKQKVLASTKFVSLLTGNRQRARLDSPESVCIDVNPLRRAAFLSAVSIAAGRASPEVHYEDQVEDLKTTVKAPTVDEARALGILILVAEDNPTNRDVIGRQLNLLGYAFEMADDGELALEAWRNNEYAILLTDCHMPNMDGFELTDAIRQDEKGLDRRSPIVAITANALEGEADRCLAAGMDDYMSKPIDMKILRAKLRQWMPDFQVKNDDTKEENVLNEKPKDPKTSEDVIDKQALMNMFGDEDMCKEILNDFVAPSQKVIEEFKIGWKERSAEAVKQAAHKLKSSARSVGANALADLCETLEQAGKEDDWTTIDDGMENLDSLMHEVENYIAEL
jgi:PAS domain S-box-containing protein